LADRPTSLANKRLVPQSVLLLVGRVIVTPHNSYEKKQNNWSKYYVEFQGQRGCRRGTRHDVLNVKEESDKGYDSRPQNKFYIRPLRGWAKTL